jgi:hypothetical protein
MTHDPAVGQRLTELFWQAVQVRDRLAPATPQHQEMVRIADRLARLMVDYDTRGEVPSEDELRDLVPPTGEAKRG